MPSAFAAHNRACLRRLVAAGGATLIVAATPAAGPMRRRCGGLVGLAIMWRAYLGLVGGIMAMLLASPVSAAAGPHPAGPVHRGDTLQFSLSENDLVGDPADAALCEDPFDFGPPLYDWNVEWPYWVGSPNTASARDIGLSFDFSVPIQASSGQFHIGVNVTGHCGGFAFHKSAQYGPYTISEPALPPESLPPEPLPPPGSGDNAPLPFSGEPVDGYCRLTHRGREVVVYVTGLACDQARDILEDRSKGGDCFSVASLKSGGPPLFICRAHGRVLISPGRGRCRPVKYEGRTYEVYRQRVLCRYARATTLRMLRNDRPYIYEFENPREGRRWRCIRRDNTGAIHGACAKRVERRWISFFPRP
jgi:hypothetical protein